MKKVSIIILSYEKIEFTKKCIKSLMKTQYDNLEVIIVDNASQNSDVLPSLVELQGECLKINISLKIILQEKNFGCATSRNAAVRISKGDYLVFIDNDTYTDDPLWLNKVIDFYESDEKIGIVSIKMLYPQHKNIIQSMGGVVAVDGRVGYWARGKENVGEEVEQIRDVQYYGAAFLFIARSLIDEIGYLPEEYDPMGFAAIDYSYQVREKGYRVVNYPLVWFYHYENTTTMHSDLLNYRYYYAKHSLMFKKRWSSWYERENQLSHNEIEKLWDFVPDFIVPPEEE